jgi:hypothetical protein
LKGEDSYHARYGERSRGIDGHEPGVRLRAAQDGGVEHVRELDIVDERGLASEEADIFPTPDRGTNVGLSHGCLLCVGPALSGVRTGMPGYGMWAMLRVNFCVFIIK